MLPDYLRSAVFRSLTKPLADGCNTSSQTAACETQTNSKTFCPDEAKNRCSVQERSTQGLDDMEEEDKEHRDNGEYQLCHIARGACQHTQTIDSKPRISNRFDEDLPRGSVDPEESMGMLSKHREASKRMSRSRLSKREELLQGGHMGFEEVVSSKRFGFQEPRFSQDGSLRSCSEQQPMRRKSNLKYKQSSEFAEDDFGSPGRMSSRRFGFEEHRHSVDGRSTNAVGQMQRINMLRLKQRSGFMEEESGFDFDERLNSRENGFQKPRFSFDSSLYGTEELKRMSQLKSEPSSRFQDMMGFKRSVQKEPGFSAEGDPRDSIEDLRRVIIDGLYRQKLLSRSPEDKRSSEGTLPCSIYAAPQSKKAKGSNLIVKLMGLQEVPPQSAEPIVKREEKKSSNVQRPIVDIERPTARKLQLVQKKKKTSPRQKSLQEIIEEMQFKGLLKSSTQLDVPRTKQQRFGERRMENLSRDGNMDDRSPPIVIMKPLYLPQWERSEVQKNLLFSANKEIEHADILRKEKVPGNGRMLHKELDRKESKGIEKVKVDFSSVSQKLQKKEAFKTRKQADESHKTWLNLSVEEEKKPVKAKSMPFPPPFRTANPSLVKSDKKHSAVKNKVSPAKPNLNNSSNSLKEKKIPRAKSNGNWSEIQANDTDCKGYKSTSPVHRMDRFSKSAGFPGESDHLLLEKEKEATGSKKDEARQSHGPSSEVMPKASKSSELAQKVIHLHGKRPATAKGAIMEDDLVHLMLSSRSFRDQAQKLHGIEECQPTHHKRNGIDEDVMRNAKLYLDCGKELMARKYQHYDLMSNLTQRNQRWNITATSTLEQIAEEISSRIRILTSYIKVDQNIASDDILYVRLERDIGCKDMLVNAMWDVGWITWGHPEEVVQLAHEIEESIVHSLITEIASEVVC